MFFLENAMATASPTGSDHLKKLAWYLDHRSHSAWDTFSPAQQNEMIEEDLAAGTWVSLVLGSLITAGLVLCTVTLLAVLLTQ